MPFTVSCAACNSRFLLGDDLFRRKVSGKVVTVRCRSCNAEISVDATEPATLPSHEPPARRAPAPPRKYREGDSATGTPLLGTTPTATGTPLPVRAPPTATGTPLPGRAASATATPLPAGALLSIWDAAEKSGDATRKPPPPRPQAIPTTRAKNAEFIEDVEDGPPSSSDAPSLTTLKHEASPPKKSTRKKANDDFFVNLSAGTGGILGAPTIDVMGLVSPPPPEAEQLLEVEATELTPRAGTVPLFDMSAVLPVPNGGIPSPTSNLSPTHEDFSVDVEMPPTPSESGQPRARKYVIAPATNEAAPAAKTKRAGAALWFVLVAAAAGVLLVVGLRSHADSHRATPEPQPAEPPPSVAERTPASELAAAIPAQVTAAAPLAPSALNAPSARPSSKVAANAPSMPGATSSPKDSAKAGETEKPAAATSKPVEAAKPAEAEKPAVQAPEPSEPAAEFDRSAAIAALKAAAAQAAACRKDGDPSGTATLTITFAPSGRVTSANIQGPPFAGTPTGGCIASAMRHAHVPAFSGDRVTVNKTIVIQ